MKYLKELTKRILQVVTFPVLMVWSLFCLSLGVGFVIIVLLAMFLAWLVNGVRGQALIDEFLTKYDNIVHKLEYYLLDKPWNFWRIL